MLPYKSKAFSVVYYIAHGVLKQSNFAHSKTLVDDLLQTLSEAGSSCRQLACLRLSSSAIHFCVSSRINLLPLAETKAEASELFIWRPN